MPTGVVGWLVGLGGEEKEREEGLEFFYGIEKVTEKFSKLSKSK